MPNLRGYNHDNADLAEVFTALIGDWDVRWEAERDFLSGSVIELARRDLEHATRDVKLIDTAMGIGLEAIKITENGLATVTGNEADPYFLKIAQDNIRSRGLDIPTLNSLWTELPQNIAGNRFDVALCIGNSIGYLPDENEIHQALLAFRKLVTDSGVVVIDSRNYKPLLDSSTKSGSPKFDTSIMAPMYNGDHVEVTVLEITDEYVHYSYKDTRTGAVGYLKLNPLSHQNLVHLFEKAGFTAQTYSDYEEGLQAECHYRQYVLRPQT